VKKRKGLIAVLCLVLLAGFINKEGPLGPPFYTYKKYGEIHIKAAAWFLADGSERLVGSYSCAMRHMSPVSTKVHPAKSLSVFGDFSISLGPKWVHIICSP